MANEKHDFSPQEQPGIERRADERVTSVYRPVLIETEEFAGFCLVRNLSAGGMMGTVYAGLAERQPITVLFQADLEVPGTISWSRDGKIGIRFDEKIDVEAVLRRLGEKYQGRKINRAPRLQIECDAILELKGRAIHCRMRDISQRGIKAEVGLLKPGDEVVVRLDGLDSHKALVRWTQGGLAGLTFVRPIPFEQLATWVIERQSG